MVVPFTTIGNSQWGVNFETGMILQNSGYWILCDKIITPVHGIARVVLKGKSDRFTLLFKTLWWLSSMLRTKSRVLTMTANSYMMYPWQPSDLSF